MLVLDLIVHKELLEQNNVPRRDAVIRAFMGEPVKLENEDVLARINHVETTSTHLARMPWIDGDYSCIEALNEAAHIAQGYDLVVLYGGCRCECLNRAAKSLTNARIPIAYDIAGTK